MDGTMNMEQNNRTKETRFHWASKAYWEKPYTSYADNIMPVRIGGSFSGIWVSRSANVEG